MAIIHAADCGVPLVNRNLKLNFSSTLEGSLLTLTCENEMSLDSTNETTLSVTCHSNGSWIPNPAQFIRSCSPISTTVPSGTEILINSSPHSSGSYSKYLSHYLLSGTIVKGLLYMHVLFIIVRYCLGSFYVI